jgi:tetratricopeptide (TPR) repeat protein
VTECGSRAYMFTRQPKIANLMKRIDSGYLQTALVVVMILASTSAFAETAEMNWKMLFSQGKYHESSIILQARHDQSPVDPEINHYLGRCYLADNSADQAFVFLHTAVELDPFNADFRFWLGVNYWALLDFDKEMESYKKALELDSDHLPSMVYLGHAYLDRGEWEEALAWYTTILDREPMHPEALYNRGLAYIGMGNEAAAAAAWEAYLEKHSAGERALQAVRKLNRQGIFSWRETLLGNHRRVLKAITFAGENAQVDRNCFQTIDLVGEFMLQNPSVVLHIIVYEEGNAGLAQKKAKQVKKCFIQRKPGIAHSRITVSWFGSPQPYEVNQKKISIESSVQLITEMK